MTESPQDSEGGQPPAAPAPPPRRRGSRLVSLAWGGSVVLLLAGVAWFVHSRTPPDPRAGRGTASVSVVTAPVVQGDLPVTLNGLGTVTPLATVTVKTQIAGRLVAIGFQEGQIVKEGDFLAEVDPRPYKIALDQAQGQLVRDTALLHDAQIDLIRYRTLAEQDSIPQQQADTQAYLVRQYEGTVKSDQAMVDSARLNLEYCHIVAPVSGRVGLRQVDLGNYVQTSDPNGLVVITQLQPISVIFTLPEDNVPAVMSRLGAGATLPVTAYDRALITKLAEGKLRTVDNQIDTTTGTVRLRAEFDNRDNHLFPNQFVTALLLVDTLKGATLVPSAAVQRGAPGTFIYVVDGERVVHLQPVKLGPTDGERFAILSGATVGAQVVVDGADKLRDGAKVTLASDVGPAGGATDRAPPASSPSSDGARKGRRKGGSP
jgi:membrane fusion protein, multidrug efflux system